MEPGGRLQRAIDFIEQNLLEELPFEVIASQAYMSSYHFQRAFALLFDITLGEYIRGRRLTLACGELRTTDDKVIDVAYKYGYDTPESFARAFGRFHGVSPSEARRGGPVRVLAPISVQSILRGSGVMERMQSRGYAVVENGPVYYTLDMDGTVKWFEDTLGWFGGIDARDEAGAGTYGCLLPMPGELVTLKIARFNGIHLFRGEPSKAAVGFIQVDDVERLRAFVLESGWNQVSEITPQPWGARECDVTTIDGGVIRFFEAI